MRVDLSTLSNALEKSNFTAHEPRLANRSVVIAFLNFRIAVCIVLQANTRADGFYNFAKVLLNLLQNTWEKNCASVFMRIIGQKSCTAMAFSDFGSSLINVQ